MEACCLCAGHGLGFSLFILPVVQRAGMPAMPMPGLRCPCPIYAPKFTYIKQSAFPAAGLRIAAAAGV
jgi:hypothetical protein